MASAGDEDDDVTEQLLARWRELNREYDAAVRAASGK
jgi:hypothetical protein